MRGVSDRPNPLLDLPIGEPRNVTRNKRGGVECPSIRADEVPATLSQAVVRINNRVTGANTAVALHAGLVGVTQDRNWQLKPIAGWHVTTVAPQIGPMLDRIVGDHETTPPVEVFTWGAPAELIELYERFGSATAADGRWRIVPYEERRRMQAEGNRPALRGIAELADGRTIALAAADRQFHWVLCRFEPDDRADRHSLWRLAASQADMPVLGTSLAMVLDVLLDGDELERLEVGRLDELDSGRL